MELDGYLGALGQLPSYDQLRMNALAIQGEQQRQGLLAQQARQQQTIFDQQQAAQEALKQDMVALGSNATPDAYWRLAAKHPQLKGIADAAQGLTDQQRRQVVGTAAQINQALANNRTDLAKAIVQRSINADKASGNQPDPDDLAIIQMLDSGDPDQIKAAKGMAYAIVAASNPDTAARTLGEYGTATDRKGQVVGRAIGHYDDQGQFVVDYRDPESAEYRTVKNADGSESLIEVSKGGGPVSGGAGAAGGSSQPRSVRNNNPGNLRGSAYTRSLPGYVRTDDAGYAVFDSRENGAAAQSNLLKTRYLDRGQNTIASIIQGVGPAGRRTHGYAPRKADGGDNTDAQVNNYIAYVAKKLNVNPNDTLTPAVLPRLAQAMSEFESGQTGQGGAVRGGGNVSSGAPGARVVFTSQPNASNPIDQASVNFYAEKIATGGDLPQLGSGKESSAWRRAILQRAAEIQSGRGISGGESNLAQADVKANRSALLQAQKQYTATVGFEDTFQRNIKEVLRLAPQGVGGSVPVFNRWIQAGRKNLKGDPAVSAFNVAVNTAANEYAKLASGASGGAITSDSARHEAMEILNNAQTLPQLRAAIKQMQIDGHNRVLALDKQIARLRGNISGAGGGQRPQAAGAPAGGRLVGTYQGRPVYQLPNGKRVVAR